ncbi:MAG: outer membrane beta-barrel protein [Crocinitomicaceae bacterium]
MRYSFLFLLFGICISGHSQRIEVGAEIGMNLIHMDELTIGNNYEPGWYGGGAFRYRFTDYFSLRSGFNYSQKRQTYSSADTTTFDFFGFVDSSMIPQGMDLNTYYNTSGRTAQHYLEIPIMASYDYKGFSVFYGGYVGFMVAARQKELTTAYTPFTAAFDIGELTGGNEFIEQLFPKGYEESYTESSTTSGLRVLDYGFKTGIGYQANGVGINASYQFGFPDYRNPAGEETKAHRFFQFSVRYMFEIGKKNTGVSRL